MEETLSLGVKFCLVTLTDTMLEVLASIAVRRLFILFLKCERPHGSCALKVLLFIAAPHRNRMCLGLLPAGHQVLLQSNDVVALTERKVECLYSQKFTYCY